MKKKVIGIGIMSIIAMVLVLSLAFLVPTTTATAVTSGGQIYLGENATFNLDGGTISGGNAENGGGVYLSSGATMEMTNGEISGNKAIYGGGVYLDGAVMTMTGGKITNNTANYGSAIYLTGSAFLDLSGGEINGTIEGDRDGADGNYLLYNDCTFSGGYIDTTGVELAIGSEPTKDIPIKCDLTAGTVVASLNGASATTSLLSHIKVQNLPDDLELKYDGDDIVLAKKVRTVTFSVNNSSYGSVSPSSVEVPSGSTYSVSSNVITFKNNGTTVATVTATPQGQSTQYTYSFNQWYNITSGATLATSGTITANMSVRADFTQSLRYYTVSFTASPSGYGSVSPSSVSVPYGTTWSVSGNTLKFANGNTTSVTATPTTNTTRNEYSFSSWSESSGTVRGATTITANFTAKTSYKITFAVSSSYGYGGTISTENSLSYSYEYANTTISLMGAKVTLSKTSWWAQAVAAGDDNYYTYSFKGWSTSSTSNSVVVSHTVTDDVTLYAVFTRETRYFTISFVASPSSYGTLSKRYVEVPYGTTWNVTSSGHLQFTNNGVVIDEVAAYPKPSTIDYTYAFVQWSPSSGTVTGNETITAIFRIISGTEYTVAFDTSITRSTSNAITDNQPIVPIAVPVTPATSPYFSKSSIKVAEGTTYTIQSSTLIAALPALSLGYTISFSDGQSVDLSWKNGTGGTDPVTYTFNRWSVSTSGTINSNITMIAYFTQKGTGGVWVGDPTEPEQPGIEDIGLGQVIAFIDKRRSLLASVVNQQGSYYREYNICYPI